MYYDSFQKKKKTFPKKFMFYSINFNYSFSICRPQLGFVVSFRLSTRYWYFIEINYQTIPLNGTDTERRLNKTLKNSILKQKYNISRI